jgi:riboflavin biosynthesis pyrimidine reductase
MRALLPMPVQDVDVHVHYARDWFDVGGIRANMVASVDGAASVAGLSRGLQTPGDNRVFAALRDLADVVLVGATTAQVEGYSPSRADSPAAARRRERGLEPRLPIALVTRSVKLDLDAPIFGDPSFRPLVITCAAGDAARRSEAESRADVLVCGDTEIDFAAARAALAERGLRRVLCEGGPSLLAAALDAGAVDELCLSVTPLLSGPGADRILTGNPWAVVPKQLRLHSLLEEDGALFARYR